MKRKPFAVLIFALTLVLFAGIEAAELKLVLPSDYQVVQRRTLREGMLRIVGTLSGGAAVGDAFEVQVGAEAAWRPLVVKREGERFSGEVVAPAGGWHRVEVRVKLMGQITASASVGHVGVGEVFVVAGQSNSANHGEEKQATQTGCVAAFDGSAWQLANDPQPGASGRGGSFMPPLGDALVKQFDVPVGFIACGIGATSVREWLPKGATFPNPPTIEGRVQKLPGGEWASKGAAYDAFIARMKPFCPGGFRAVLWHQGESDANQKDAARTLPGKLYREYLEKLIRDSRRDTGFAAPWFVAQASYHVPGDEGSEDIRAAQASLWRDGVALAGPDSDALKGKLRERDGKGVHFSGEGLRVHAAKWAEKIVPWIRSQQ